MSAELAELVNSTRDYQLEPLSDESRLRLIIWPRKAGKSYFIALDTVRISEFPYAHAVIVHADAGELYTMKTKWLMGVNPSTYTQTTYRYLADHMERIIERARGKNVWLYFEEPDLYPDDDMTSAAVISAFIAIMSMGNTTAIQQVTYIGTASNVGGPSRIVKLMEFVPIVHSAHPREMWGDEWVIYANELAHTLDREMFRTEVMGHF